MIIHNEVVGTILNLLTLVKRDTLSYLMLYKGKLDQIIMCLYVEVICKIQTMYVTNLRSGLEYIVKEQNDLAKDYYKKIAQPVRV